MSLGRIFSLPLLLSFVLLTASAQQSGPAAQDASSAPTSSSSSPQAQSLADIARGLRKNRQAIVQTTPQDAKELFRSVDRIFEFASEDTGLPRKTTVKRRLVGAADVENYVRQRMAHQEYAERFARSELTMKKFGLLPRDFHLREFLVQATGQDVAGYYDDENKVISLLNWVPLDRQEPILAHELTHALQDQNYDLQKWMKKTAPPSKPTEANFEDGESTTARRAVIEGQAMVVLYDYLLAPLGRTLKDTPEVVASMQDPSVIALIDTPLMHNAPLVLRESGQFPYREGLFFEAALLKKGGKQLAFAGAFAHPPRSTHEVLQPDTYLRGEKLASVPIPDLGSLLGDKYELYDSGAFGELDVRVWLRQWADKRGAADISPAWQGGGYLAFRPKPGQAADAPLTPAELTLVYVSRWRTHQAAERFAQLYARGTLKRYNSAHMEPSVPCSETQCPITISTEEGPVIIEPCPDDTLLISEGLDQATQRKLRAAILSPPKGYKASFLPPEELSLRLNWLPAFRQFQLRLGQQIWSALATQIGAGIGRQAAGAGD